jgi:small-conductance mechanosensitive channel
MRLTLAVLACLALDAMPAYSETPPAGEPAVVMLWNREIAELRASYAGRTPAQRAAGASSRLAELPVSGPWSVEAVPAAMGIHTGALVNVNGVMVVGFMDGDVPDDSGLTPLTLAQSAAGRVQEFLQARERQHSPRLLLVGALKGLAATLIVIAALAALIWARSRLMRLADARVASALKSVKLGDLNIDFTPLVCGFQKGSVALASLVLGCLTVYSYLHFTFRLFPYTQPWGDHLGHFFLASLQSLFGGMVRAMPSLFMVLLILVITRFLTRLIGGFFLSVEHGLIKSDWLRPDTARATRRIVGALIWAFALTVAYPYIPGSSSAAFKGVSVFIGLMVSLGSAGLINQIISGLLVVYSRAFETGEVVRVGETEGVVTAVGLLSTKITTIRREVVTVPNALLVGTPTWNFSTYDRGKGAMLSTTVTVGYDVPWRLVHAMLREATSRTEGVVRESEPVILQKALSDFFVEYCLMLQITDTLQRLPTLSRLHAQIQDVFNANGVQLMVPHYEGQPAEKVWVPKQNWAPEPAKRDVPAEQV